MKIKVPVYFKDYDLTDGQKILASVLTMAFNYEDKDTEFYIRAKDVRVMLGSRSVKGCRNNHILPFVNYFTIGMYTAEVWSFRLKDPAAQTYQGRIQWEWQKLESQYAARLYSYVVGALHPWEKGCTMHKNIKELRDQERPFTHWMDEVFRFTADAYEKNYHEE